ncbi:MAG TPA: V-type ATP synthase subunit C [bacterium]|nr:V-type ATP synthase subunit C [bacterium]
MDTRYAYITGRVRALEARLLDKLKIERMIAAPSAKASLSELEETDYGPYASQLKEINNFEDLLYDELKRLYSFIDKGSLDKELTDLFRLRYDFHNLKVFLKNKFKEKPLPLEKLPLIDLGTIEPRKVGEAKEFLQIQKETTRAFEEKKNPQDIDIILDKEYYRLCVEKAEESENGFVIDLFHTEIDLINIKTFFRCRTLKRDKNFFSKVLIGEGSLTKRLFLEFYEKEESAFLRKLSFTSYAKVIIGYEKEGLKGLELSCDNFFLEYIKKTKFITAGLEVLIAYLIAKENEINLLRSVLTGKINEIPAQMIRERLRETFV